MFDSFNLSGLNCILEQLNPVTFYFNHTVFPTLLFIMDWSNYFSFLSKTLMYLLIMNIKK